eukprot:TRINITY_DN19369_c0_g1_i2.p1 TRINITY_DN19369_c0_g1~~TRINITY_DN19369_c0_g1_i2.p1  ORF type:complete len:919 (-),score=136.58 TRINITY_DN19369_c0_g1_i2:189-2918(-)
MSVRGRLLQFLVVAAGIGPFKLALASSTHSHGIQIDERSTVVDGAWRFTAVTDRLIRVEHDGAQHFVDVPTLAFFERGSPTGAFVETAKDGEFSILKTKLVTVRYVKESVPSPKTLAILTRAGDFHWTWGDDQAVGNLGGTARTLDGNAETLDLNCHHKVSPTTDNSEEHCVFGLASKNGWALVNDTGAPIWENGFFAASKRNSIDVYLFMHGLDFQGALTDFFHAAGRSALPPRYAMGTMFTRWFNFDSESVRGLVEDFESHSMPLDAWIFDMNWHQFGPWGSFSWNNNSFPDLSNLLDWFQAKKLPIGANTHDHDGVRTSEATYAQMCEALGCTHGEDIPFDLYNKTFAMAQEDIAIRALDSKNGKQGLDFYWIDYQQGETDTFQKTTIPNINPTIVLNMLRSMDPSRHGENRRPLILSRWGGMGSHRYPLGFSGDQMHDWKGLSFLPYFTSTAANVAFNYWSHDTVGGDHERADDYELSVRWVQTSAWSPVLRFHDKGAGTGNCATTDVCARIVPWDLPSVFFKAVRSASQERDALIPYIYTASFNAMSTGAALVRPMYYEKPSSENLYGLDKQYLFGPDMVISPISQPSGPEAKGFRQALGAVSWSVYAPETDTWFDRINGDFASGSTVTHTYGIFDVPGFVRQGAVIPMRPQSPHQSSLARARRSLDEVEFRFTPAKAFYTGGSFSGSGVAIDDDGMTTDYLHGKYTKTTCDYNFQGRTFVIHLSQTGDFNARPQQVTLRLSFPQLPPFSAGGSASILVNGKTTVAPLSYDTHILGPVVTLENVDLKAKVSITLTLDASYSDEHLKDFMGLLGHVHRARYAKDALDALNTPYGADRAQLTALALAGVSMSPSYAARIPKMVEDAKSEVKALLESNQDLLKDQRRAKFVSDIMELSSLSEVERLI